MAAGLVGSSVVLIGFLRVSGLNTTEPVFVNLLKSSGIDSEPGEIDSSIPRVLKRLQIRVGFVLRGTCTGLIRGRHSWGSSRTKFN